MSKTEELKPLPERRAQWRALVDEANESGELPSQFCQARGVDLAPFYYWRQAFARQDAAQDPDARFALARRGFDGLRALAGHVIGVDPLDGHLFAFRGRRRDRVKILYWDRDGWALWAKQLARFPHFRVSPFRAESRLNGQRCAPARFAGVRFSPSPEGNQELVNGTPRIVRTQAERPERATVVRAGRSPSGGASTGVGDSTPRNNRLMNRSPRRRDAGSLC